MPTKTLPSATALAMMTGLLLIGCGPAGPYPHAPVQPEISPKRVEARQVELEHTVLFGTDQAELDTIEMIALENFARSLSPSEVLSVSVIGHADERASSGYNLELSARRARHVAEVLGKHGLPGVQVSAAALGETVPRSNEAGEEGWRQNRRVTVVAEAVELILPSCPDWSARIGYEPLNRPMSNLGCANALNFAAMIANPRELIDPGQIGRPDPTHAAESIHRYREGEVTELTEETASE